MKQKIRKENIIYPNLSYKIVGILFNVYNELGYGYHEKYYQRAISRELSDSGIGFQEQVSASLIFNQKTIGRFFLDFLIEDKIILEIKKDSRFSKKHIDQVNNYLKAYNKKLALLVNFDRDGVKFKRLVNIL